MENEVSKMIRLANTVAFERSGAHEMEPEEFAREVRRLAVDAYRGLTYPDVPRDVLARLKRRSQVLLDQIRESGAIEMTRWLCSVDRAIDVRLRYEDKVGPSASQTEVAKSTERCEARARPLIRLYADPECDAPMPACATAG
jgi:hypothetical protein